MAIFGFLRLSFAQFCVATKLFLLRMCQPGFIYITSLCSLCSLWLRKGFNAPAFAHAHGTADKTERQIVGFRVDLGP
jgi:hypothetical protein